MISISSTQLDAWFALFIWPFMRITALMLSEPVLGNQAIPRRIRVAISVILTLTIAPLLPTPPVVNFVSAQGLLIAAQQLLIGVTLGLSMRMVLNGIEMAGHIAGLSMGLGFATFFDPQNGAQSVVIAQFLGIFAMLIFFALNGHLMVISALYESFQVLPISSAPLNALGFLAVAVLAFACRHLNRQHRVGRARPRGTAVEFIRCRFSAHDYGWFCDANDVLAVFPAADFALDGRGCATRP
jgi:flagellar biosynthetic protein FliR